MSGTENNISMRARPHDEPATHIGETPFWRAIYFVCAIALSVAYFHSAIGVSLYKHLWMDEILAVTAASQPTFAGVTNAIWAGTDFSPPLLHYLLHSLIYDGDVFSVPLIYRVPSIVSVFMAAWLSSVLVRRYLGAAMALVAFALILGSGLFEFAVQARQYGLLSLDLAAALLVWDGFRHTRYPVASVLALWTIFAIGLCTHFYGFLSIVAIGTCEVLYWLTGGGIRWKIWLALVLTVPVEVALRPLAAHLASFNAGDNKALAYYAHPTVGAFFEALWKVLLGGSGSILVIVVAAFFAILISLARYSPWLVEKLDAMEGVKATPTSIPERRQFEIVLASLLLLPFFIFAFALLVTGSFSYRYIVGGTLFVGMAGSYLLDKLPYRRLVTLLIMPVLIAMVVARGRVHDDVSNVLANLSRIPTGLPIVVENGRDYIELMGANDNPSKDRLYFLENPAGYVSPDPTNQHAVARVAPLEKDYKVVAVREFLAQHRDFYLFTTPEHGTSAGFLPWLFADSIRSRLVFSGPDSTVLLVHQGDK